MRVSFSSCGAVPRAEAIGVQSVGTILTTKELRMPSVLITGTSKGIGLEAALAFGRAGYQVHATMRNPSQSPELAQTVAREKLPITVSAMDVDSDESVRRAMTAIQAQGPIDVLVNNAGVERSGS